MWKYWMGFPWYCISYLSHLHNEKNTLITLKEEHAKTPYTKETLEDRLKNTSILKNHDIDKIANYFNVDPFPEADDFITEYRNINKKYLT